MLDHTTNDNTPNEADGAADAKGDDTTSAPQVTTTRRRAAGRPAGPPVAVAFQAPPAGLAPALPKPDRDDDEPPRNKAAAKQSQADDDADRRAVGASLPDTSVACGVCDTG